MSERLFSWSREGEIPDLEEHLESKRQEYRLSRDTFLRALRAMEDVQDEYLDLLDWSFPTENIRAHLNEQGYWLTGDEYVMVTAVIKLLQELVGRAHARGVK